MESSVFECSICCNYYNDGKAPILKFQGIYRPLSLPCGHVFCETCIKKCTYTGKPQNMTEEQEKEIHTSETYIVCPSDKKNHFTTPSKLPCCYAILSNIPKQILEQSNSSLSMASENKAQTISSHTESRKERRKEVAICCMRHPTKKVKFFCETHIEFFCSDCVLSHTGPGHAVSHFSVDLKRIQNDYTDVYKKFEEAFKIVKLDKDRSDIYEKKLIEHYNCQLNKLNMAYDSAIKIINEKRKHFTEYLKQNFGDQKRKFDIEKHKVQRKYEKVKESTKQIGNLGGSKLNQMHYEEFYKLMMQKTQELKTLTQSSASSLSSLPKEFVVALFKDTIKLSELGSIKFESIKTSDWEGSLVHSSGIIDIHQKDSWVCKKCFALNKLRGSHCAFCKKPVQAEKEPFKSHDANTSGTKGSYKLSPDEKIKLNQDVSGELQNLMLHHQPFSAEFSAQGSALKTNSSSGGASINSGNVSSRGMIPKTEEKHFPVMQQPPSAQMTSNLGPSASCFNPGKIHTGSSSGIQRDNNTSQSSSSHCLDSSTSYKEKSSKEYDSGSSKKKIKESALLKNKALDLDDLSTDCSRKIDFPNEEENSHRNSGHHNTSEHSINQKLDINMASFKGAKRDSVRPHEDKASSLLKEDVLSATVGVDKKRTRIEIQGGNNLQSSTANANHRYDSHKRSKRDQQPLPGQQKSSKKRGSRSNSMSKGNTPILTTNAATYNVFEANILSMQATSEDNNKAETVILNANRDRTQSGSRNKVNVENQLKQGMNTNSSNFIGIFNGAAGSNGLGEDDLSMKYSTNAQQNNSGHKKQSSKHDKSNGHGRSKHKNNGERKKNHHHSKKKQHKRNVSV